LHGGGAENGLLRDVISYSAKTQGTVNYSGIWHFMGANHDAIVSANANNGRENITELGCLFDDAGNPEILKY